MGYAEFFNRMVEVLGITIGRRSKGIPRKVESQIIEKIGCALILII